MSKLKYFQVFGERNSGTNYLMKLLEANLKHVESTRGETGFGWKHGDIGSDWPYYENGGQKWYKHRDISKASDTLVLVVYRNPFTWIQSMQRSPHHAPDMLNLPMDEFVSRKWESYYSPPGDDFSQDPEVRESIKIKSNLFEQFDSVLDLRNQKNRMFEEFKGKLPNVAYVNYELLAPDPEAFLQKIALAYGLNLKPSFENVTSEKFGKGEYKKKDYEPYSQESFGRVVSQLDWDLEASIGYELKDSYVRLLDATRHFINKPIRKPDNAIKIIDRTRFYRVGREL